MPKIPRNLILGSKNKIVLIVLKAISSFLPLDDLYQFKQVPRI